MTPERSTIDRDATSTVPPRHGGGRRLALAAGQPLEGRPADARPDSGPYGALAVRTLMAVGIGALLLAANVRSLALILLVVVAILAFDNHNPLSLKNFLLVYMVMVFGVGGTTLHLTNRPVYGAVAAYTVIFLGAYALASMPRPAGQNEGERSRTPLRKGPLNLLALEHALLTLIGLNLLFLAFQFLTYGVVGYYRGQGLLTQALTYGQASSAGGLEQIVRFGLSDAAVALVILYVKGCFESSSPIRYRYPAILFVVLPILSLARFNALDGAFILLAIYACERRLVSQRGSDTPASHSLRSVAAVSRRDGVAPNASARRVSRLGLIILGLVLAITTAALVASIRGGFANKSGTVNSSPDAVAMFGSELSPVQAYGDIQANLNVLGRTHGKTILFPLLLKVVPRAWYPNKPLNSGAYYMSKLRPTEWAAGYGLPPTIFGDAYLSFGLGGAIVASLLLGLLAGRIDLAYRGAVLTQMPAYLLIFANFYALLRDPLSESLAGIGLTMLVWAVANRAFRPARPVIAGQPAEANI